MRYPVNFQRTPVTMLLLGVMIALELFYQIRPEMRVNFYNEYVGMLPSFWAGEMWRPLTSSLVHVNLLHAAFNLWWFTIFSSALEPYFGWKRYLGLIVLLAYVSMLPEFVIFGYTWNEPAMIAGLSGVLYGLFGLLLVGRRYRDDFYRVCTYQDSQLLVAWFFICIVITWLGLMNVANIAHGAGWFFGWLYGMAIFSQRDRRRWIAAAFILSVLVFMTLIVCPKIGPFENGWFESMEYHRELWWQQLRKLF